MEQILTNLIGNSLKFTAEGEIEFGYRKENSQLIFWVRDTGTGIPKEKQELIFERFRQAAAPPFKAEEGSGLGLSISKAFVLLMGGRITVESEPGEGALFSFTLPHNAWPLYKS